MNPSDEHIYLRLNSEEPVTLINVIEEDKLKIHKFEDKFRRRMFVRREIKIDKKLIIVKKIK